jgi:hypothetical protein
MCPQILRQHPRRLPTLLFMYFPTHSPFWEFLSSSFKHGSKSKKPDKTPTIYTAKRVRRGTNEIFAHLACYAAQTGGNRLFRTTYRPHLQEPSSPTNRLTRNTSLTTSLRWLTTQKSEDLIDAVQFLRCPRKSLGLLSCGTWCFVIW